MSDMPGGDPLEAIKAKMAADPSYNPMSDPQAMQVLESMMKISVRDWWIGQTSFVRPFMMEGLRRLSVLVV